MHMNAFDPWDWERWRDTDRQSKHANMQAVAVYMHTTIVCHASFYNIGLMLLLCFVEMLPCPSSWFHLLSSLMQIPPRH